MALSAIVLGTVLSVVDGDTIKINVADCNYKVLCENVGVRFEGIDAPELKGKCDKEKDMALKAKKLVEENYKSGDPINLGKAKRDNHFRLLSRQDVIATRLIQSGLAVKYTGRGAKHDWCK